MILGKTHKSKQKGQTAMETKTNPNHRKHASNLINGLLWGGKSLSANFTNTMIVTYLAFYATDVWGWVQR